LRFIHFPFLSDVRDSVLLIGSIACPGVPERPAFLAGNTRRRDFLRGAAGTDRGRERTAAAGYGRRPPAIGIGR